MNCSQSYDESGFWMDSYVHFILLMLPHFFVMLPDNTIRVTQIPKGEEQIELL